jgi:hypothetical protein
MMFLGLLLFIYCVIGAIVGAVCWMQGKWPKYMPNSDKVVDDAKTLLFALLCGPLFWVGGLLFIIFRFVIGLLKEEA